MSLNSDESAVEGVIIISLDEQPPDYTIKKILKVETLSSPSFEKDQLKGYEWKVNTKYYSATVNLYSVPDKIELNSEFCDKIRATVFSFDGNKPSSFEGVLNWMPLLENIRSEVQLLICDSCDSDESLRKKVLDWCVENEFELIELNPSEETDEDDSGIFSKSKGYGRVIEALQSHMWSNLIMKESSKDQNQFQKNEENSSSMSTSSSQKSADKTKKMTVEDEELLLEEQWLQKVMDGDDPNGESFEALFTKFASMKERASHLTGEDRKKYAEKVAVAFWKAMGGEEDEIAGLDDE